MKTYFRLPNIKLLRYLFSIFTLFAVFSCNENPVKPISIDFTFVADASDEAPATLSFNATPISGIKVYRWSFGDGTTDSSTVANIKHTYKQAGTYEVKLSVNTTSQISKNITIKPSFVIFSDVQAREVRKSMMDNFTEIYGGRFQVMNGLRSDVLQYVGTNTNYADLDIYQQKADNAVILELWNYYQKTINEANRIIQDINTINTLSTTERNQIKGEALFIRAYCLFDMLRMWNTVPYSNVPRRDITKFPNQLNWQAIIALANQSLYEAIDLVVFADTNDFYHTTITRNVIYSLLIRVAYYQGNYAECVQLANQINSLQNLVFNYNEIYANIANKEVIWQVDATANVSKMCTSISKGGTDEIALHEGFVKSIQIDDNRRSILDFSMPATTMSIALQHTSTKVPLFKISELLYILSESNAQIGNFYQGLQTTNLLLNRAKLPLYNQSPNLQNLVIFIREQRKIELAFEGERIFDLIRNGTYLENLKDLQRQQNPTTVSLLSPNLLYLPIPQQAIQNNPNLRQNLGY